MTGPADPERTGFAERTVLAWQRTALAVVTLALVQLRLASGDAPGAVLAVLVLAAGIAVLAGLDARRRDRGGRVGLLLTVAVLVLGAAELGLALA